MLKSALFSLLILTVTLMASGYVSAKEVVFGDQDIRLDNDPPGAASSWNLKISSDEKGNIYAVWSDTRNGWASDIYFNRSSDYGATWQENDTRLDTDQPGAERSFSPKISSDESGNVYVVWEDYRNLIKGSHADIYFNHSSDFGATWQENDTRLDTDPPGDALSRSAQISSDESGNVYVIWEDLRDLGQNIYFNRSSDYGATWQENDSMLNTSGRSSGAINISNDQSGNVYAAWMSYKNGKYNIYFNHSDDFGATWQAKDTRLGTDPMGTASFGYPRISNDDSGNVYVVWKDFTTCCYREIFFNHSDDFGATWQANDTRLDIGLPGLLGACCYQISNDENGNVYVVLENRSFIYEGRWPPRYVTDIYFNHSYDFGTTWQTRATRLDSDPIKSANSVSPQISNDESGNVCVVWEDWRDDSRDIYFNYSLDYGVTWQANDSRLTNEPPWEYGPPVLTPQISSNESGNVYVVWQSIRNGFPDIYFKSGVLVDRLIYGAGQILAADGNRVKFGLKLNCDGNQDHANLHVNWGRDSFELDSVASADCFHLPGIDPDRPVTSFDTIVGSGTGHLNRAPGHTAVYGFVDNGESYKKGDFAFIMILDSEFNPVLEISDFIFGGNIQTMQNEGP